MSDLQEMLSDEPAATEQATETPAPEASAEASAEATGEEQATPAADSGVESESTEAAESRQVPLAALKEERKKRQELERQLAMQQGREQAMRELGAPQQQAQQEVSADDLYYRDPVKFTENLVMNQRLAMSEEFMRMQHDDYDAVIDAFAEAAKQSPVLIEQMRASAMPAKFAYEHGKTYNEAKEIGSIDALREKIRAEERAKIEAELKKTNALSAAGAISPSTAGVRSMGAQGGDGGGQDSLADILGR